MAKEQKAASADEAALAEVAVATPSTGLPGLNALAAYGGFPFVESFIDGIQNISPERKARKNIFMTDENKKVERLMLKQKLNLWIELLESSNNQTEMLEKTEEKANLSNAQLRKNLLRALNSTRELERSYRALSLFYKNTDLDKVPNVTVLNASLAQLTDLDNPIFIDHVAAEFKQNYDRLDLRSNYSLLVVPGFMRTNGILDKWARLAHNNKVMLITDFADLESPEDTIELFSTANMSSGDLHSSNVIMACNWMVGRGKVAEVGETDNLYVPPSAALAGKIYYTLMSQVTAGKKHGGMNEVDGVRFPLKKSEISHLERLGLVPMVFEYGKVMAFSAKTLFNGDNPGLQTYSVVRVFDHVVKVLFDFLNRRAFENWTPRMEADLRRQIVQFLDSIMGPDRLIEKHSIMRFERDKHIKDLIHLDLFIKPYFPAKSFVIRLDGRRGDDVDSPEWVSDYGVMS